MKSFKSGYFTYRENKLFCENVPVQKIAEEFGTPVYIYSKNFFIDSFNKFNDAFKDINHSIFFACKSNFNLSVIKTFADLGSGVDVNSEGELFRALKSGVNPGKIIFSGVGKTPHEIKFGLEKNVLMIKAESQQEIYLINEIAASMNKIAPVAIRVNPDVDAQTHPYVSTGLAENKFGIESKETVKLFHEYKNLKNIKFCGIDMHIGSQITKVEPFAAAVEKLAEIFLQLKSEGIPLEHLDVGGGIGITYNNESTFELNELANKLIPIFRKLNCDIFFEPGRFLTANAGILAASVLYTKKNHNKNFIIVDAAMTDLIRPSIYGSYHHIQPVEITDAKDIVADIVGPVCESGDFLARNREFFECKQGDYLAVMSAGAYGMTMASNYNSRRRPPEVLVNGNDYKLIRSRESLENLFLDEDKLL